MPKDTKIISFLKCYRHHRTPYMCLFQCVQICYGFFMASEVAYYTYIYAKVDKDKYQLVTGHTRSAILVGRFLSAVLAQLLYSYSLMNVRELNYISFGCKSKWLQCYEYIQ